MCRPPRAPATALRPILGLSGGLADGAPSASESGLVLALDRHQRQARRATGHGRGPNVLNPEWITNMAADPVVFALANPDPEVDVDAAQGLAAALAAGRSDFPNQISNVLAFPGVFRGPSTPAPER